MHHDEIGPFVALDDAAALLGVQAEILRRILAQQGATLGEGSRLTLVDLLRLRRHPDVAVAAARSEEASSWGDSPERGHLLGRIRELERRVTSQRSEIESLRRAVLLGRAERERLIQGQASSRAS